MMPMVFPFLYFVTLGYENWLEKLTGKEKIKMWISRGGQAIAVLSALLTYFLVYRAAY